MESEDLRAILLATLLITVYSYSFYRLGRFLERRDLTKYFAENVEAAYFDGKDDGRKEGFKAGERLGLATCDDVLQSREDGGNR